MNEKAIRALMRLLAVGGLSILLLFVYTLWQSYEGRVDLRDSQVAGCQRALKDRKANAAGWRTAEGARRNSGALNDLRAADQYAGIVSGLEERAGIDCERAFPKPTLLPF